MKKLLLLPLLIFALVSTFFSAHSQTAVALNGINQYTQTGLGIGMSTFTIEMDVYPQAGNSQFDKLFSLNNQGFFDIAIDPSGVVRLYSSPIGLTNWPILTNLPLNTYSHLALSYTPGQIRAYVNGVQVSVIPCGGYSFGFSNFILGTTAGAYNQYAKVKIDNFRLWNIPRNPTEILANYQTCLTGFESNLVVLYTFDEGAGSMTMDSAPYFGQNNASLYNGVTWESHVSCGVSCTEPTIPTITATPNPVCSGTLVTLNFSGDLNDATQWTLYTGSCGGTFFNATTGNSYTMNMPGVPTTYFVRGEGGCTSSTSCGTITLSPGTSDGDGDGFTPCQGDCDDTNPAIYPGAVEICDGFDNNCDGQIDESVVADQTITTSSFSAFCLADTTINLASSQLGINYFLRNDADNSVVDGPVTGTGNPISFNTGAIQTSTTYSINAVTQSYALEFDGINDEVIIADNSLLDIASAITIESWIKPTKTGVGSQNVLSKSSTTQNNGYIFPRSDDSWNNFIAYLHIGGTWRTLSAPYPTIAEWHHLAVSYDGAMIRLYLDGLEVNTLAVSGTISINSNPLVFGNQFGYSEFFGGAMNDARIWSTARSQIEIQANMNACISNSEPGLVVLYTMEDGSGLTLTDQANGFDGLLQNMDATTSWINAEGNTGCGSCAFDMSQTIAATIETVISDTSTVSACNSFTWTENGTTYSTSGLYSETYSSANGCDSIIVLDLTINYSTSGTDVITACNSYTWLDGNTYTSSNNAATHIIPNAAGCDSTITLDLTINYATSGTDMITACDTYTWLDGNTYTASNNSATHIIQNAAGCDSIITLDLTIATILPQTVTAVEPNLCDGNSGTTISVAGSQTGVLYSLYDADADTLVDGPIAGTGNPISFSTGSLANTMNFNVVGENPVAIAGNSVRFDGVDDYLEITSVPPPFSSYPNIIEAWVYLESYGSGMTIVEEPGAYHFYIDNAGQMHYAYNPNGPWIDEYDQFGTPVPLNQWVNIAVFPDAVKFFYINGVQASASNTSIGYPMTSGSMTVGGTNSGNQAGGTLHGRMDQLAIWGTYSTAEIFDLSCIDVNSPGLEMFFDFEEGAGNILVDYNGPINDTLVMQLMDVPNAWKSGVGCGTCNADMANVITVNVNSSSTGTDVIAACDSYTWLDGNSYTSSNNSATHIIPNAAGCDSIITLDLTINYSTSSTDVITACDSYTWLDGTTYTSSNNTATHIIPNAAGCDSIITLDLTINNATSSTDVITACDTYTWLDGNTYTASNNTATHIIQNAAGCDSIITLDLTINYATSSTDVVTACDAFTWLDGNTYTASNGTATHIIQNAAGCDSIITLDLTINYATSSTDVNTACDAYTWLDGNTYTSSNNTATHVIPNAAGCDSTITLDLTINYATSSTDVITACDAYTWLDGNTYTASNNSATHVIPNAAGCDSTITLDLTINTIDLSVSVLEETISANQLGGTYQWIDCATNDPIIGETGSSFTALANGDYAVIITLNNCSDTSDCAEITTVGIDDHESLSLNVYPNPTSGIVTIQFDQQMNGVVSLIDCNGKLLKQVDTNNNATVQLSLLEFESGTYFIQIQTEVFNKIQKVVKY